MRYATIALTLVVGIAIGAGSMWWWMIQPKTYTGYALVTDGDTIRLGDKDAKRGKRRRIRFVGINTPKLQDSCRWYKPNRQDCQEPAAVALHKRIGNKEVTCAETGRDYRGRTLAICWHDGVELNTWLLEECLAHSPRNPRHREARYEAVINKRQCGR